MADHLMKGYREQGESWVVKSRLAIKRLYSDIIWRQKYKDASIYLERAACCFRISKSFENAGSCYRKAAGFERRLGNYLAAAQFYHEAAVCYEKDDPHAAVECYGNAVNVYCQVSKFQTAAKLEAEVAVLMEGDKNYGEACKRWRRACNFLKADGVHDDKAGLCLLRAADHAATMGNYEEASALYEEIGHSLLQSSLLKFSASRIFLRSLLCYLAMGSVSKTKYKLKKMCRSHRVDGTLFAASPERSFVETILKAFSGGDIDLFADHVYAFDNAFQLDSWSIRVLAQIKFKIEAKVVKRKEQQDAAAKAAQEAAKLLAGDALTVEDQISNDDAQLDMWNQSVEESEAAARSDVLDGTKSSGGADIRSDSRTDGTDAHNLPEESDESVSDSSQESDSDSTEEDSDEDDSDSEGIESGDIESDSDSNSESDRSSSA